MENGKQEENFMPIIEVNNEITSPPLIEEVTKNINEGDKEKIVLTTQEQLSQECSFAIEMDRVRNYFNEERRDVEAKGYDNMSSEEDRYRLDESVYKYNKELYPIDDEEERIKKNPEEEYEKIFDKYIKYILQNYEELNTDIKYRNHFHTNTTFKDLLKKLVFCTTFLKENRYFVIKKKIEDLRKITSEDDFYKIEKITILPSFRDLKKEFNPEYYSKYRPGVY